MNEASILLDLVITIGVYLLFPVCLAFTKLPITKFKANMIALINSIVCCLIFAIIRLDMTGKFSLGFGPATLYFFINKRILAKNIVSDKDINEDEETEEDEEYEVDDEDYDEEVDDLYNETDDPDEEVENETDEINEEDEEELNDEEYEEVDTEADNSKNNQENEYALEIKRLKTLYLKWEKLFKDILNENPSLKDKYEECEEADQEEIAEPDKKEEKELDKIDEADDVDDNQLRKENQQDKSELGQNLSDKKDES